jgi:hypothetical protein
MTALAAKWLDTNSAFEAPSFSNASVCYCIPLRRASSANFGKRNISSIDGYFLGMRICFPRGVILTRLPNEMLVINATLMAIVAQMRSFKRSVIRLANSLVKDDPVRHVLLAIVLKMAISLSIFAKRPQDALVSVNAQCRQKVLKALACLYDWRSSVCVAKLSHPSSMRKAKITVSPLCCASVNRTKRRLCDSLFGNFFLSYYSWMRRIGATSFSKSSVVVLTKSVCLNWFFATFKRANFGRLFSHLFAATRLCVATYHRSTDYRGHLATVATANELSKSIARRLVIFVKTNHFQISKSHPSEIANPAWALINTNHLTPLMSFSTN